MQTSQGEESGTKRVKVLLAIDEMEIGGSQQQVSLLLTNFDRSKFEVELLYFRTRSVLVTRLEKTGIRCHLIEKRHRIDPLFFLRLCLLFRSQKYDLVHAFSLTAELWCALAYKLTGGKKFYCSVRGTYEWYTKFDWILKRFIANRSCGVLANSETGCRYALMNMGEKYRPKFHVVANGVIPPAPLAIHDASRLRATLDIGLHAPVLVFVGRLVNHKNIPCLMRALAIVLEDFPDLRTLIVGSGSLRQELSDLAESLSIRKSVSFLGERKDVTSIIQIADVLVLPSFREGLSNSIMEAMSAGISVIVSNVGGNMELVDDQRTGLVFPSDDEQELGRGIVRLLSDEDLRARLGVQAVKTMSDEFSIERLVTQVQEIYLG